MACQVNLVRSKVRQRMLTRLAESSGRPLERHGNVSPREMAVEGIPRERPRNRTRRIGRPIRLINRDQEFSARPGGGACVPLLPQYWAAGLAIGLSNPGASHTCGNGGCQVLLTEFHSQ